MTNDSETTFSPHHGRNIKRIREIKGIKQIALAESLSKKTGENYDQSRVSYMENRASIEDKLIAEVAEILEVPAEAIKHWPEQQLPAVLISPVFKEQSNAFAWFPTYHVNSKMIDLFERLVSSEKEKVELLKRDQDLQRKEIELLKKEIESLKRK